MVRFNLVPTFGSADSYDSYVGDFEKKVAQERFLVSFGFNNILIIIKKLAYLSNRIDGRWILPVYIYDP